MNKYDIENNQEDSTRVDALSQRSTLRRGWDAWKAVKLPGWASALLFIAIPYAAFFVLEVFTHDPIAMSWPIQRLNYFVYLCIMGLFFALFGSAKRAARALVTLAYLVGLVNYLVISFRGTPIAPWDYRSVNTAISVLGTYEFPWSKAFWTATLVFILVWVVSGFMVGQVRSWVWRVVSFAGVMVCFMAVLGFVNDEAYAKKIKLNNTLFTPGVMYRTNGFSLAFIRNFAYMKIEEPEDYSIDRVNDIIDDYLGRTLQRLQSGVDLEGYRDVAAKQNQPNVIVVMSEGFSELQALANFTTNEDYLPYFNSLSAADGNVIKGYAHSSIVGGNTATSEFEFLTSDTMAFLPTGSVAYQQFIFGEMPTLNSLLEEQGYHSVAMHPYGAKGWERDQVYPYFGFDKMKFISDFKYRKKIRTYVSDEALFNEILLELDQAPEDQPSFIFTVSMQNHGGYSKRVDSFPVNIDITEEGNYEWVEHYLSLLQETDRQLEIFFDQLNELEEDTIVLFFGDHQPNDSTVHALKQLESFDYSPQARQTVPYLIWANFDLGTDADADVEDVALTLDAAYANGQVTSLNFLAAELLEAAGLVTSPYMDFLSDLRETIPVMTADYFMTADGRFHSYSDPIASDPVIAELLEAYEILQYNHLVDTKNRVAGVFSEK